MASWTFRTPLKFKGFSIHSVISRNFSNEILSVMPINVPEIQGKLLYARWHGLTARFFSQFVKVQKRNNSKLTKTSSVPRRPAVLGLGATNPGTVFYRMWSEARAIRTPNLAGFHRVTKKCLADTWNVCLETAKISHSNHQIFSQKHQICSTLGLFDAESLQHSENIWFNRSPTHLGAAKWPRVDATQKSHVLINLLMCAYRQLSLPFLVYSLEITQK